MNRLSFGELLAIEEAGYDKFVAKPHGRGFLFGGLSAALALRSAMRTVREDLQPLSMQMLFLNGGDWGGPHHLTVERVADSGRFARRRVTMAQEDGRDITTAFVSFHAPEKGVDWQMAPPAAPAPERLTGWPGRFGAALDLVEVRTVHGVPRETGGTLHPYWARCHNLADDAAERTCSLTFLSDYMVIHTPFERSGDKGQRLVSRTLEHAIWFHRPVADGDWLLFSCEPISTVGGRYVSRGEVHDRRGVLLASFTQSGFMRPFLPHS